MPHADRPTHALLAPVTAIGRELAALLQNRRAFAGGLLGSCLCCGLASALVLLGPGDSHGKVPDDTDVLIIEFLPGELVRLGEVRDPLEKIILREIQAAPPTATSTVTTDEQASAQGPAQREARPEAQWCPDLRTKPAQQHPLRRSAHRRAPGRRPLRLRRRLV